MAVSRNVDDSLDHHVLSAPSSHHPLTHHRSPSPDHIRPLDIRPLTSAGRRHGCPLAPAVAALPAASASREPAAAPGHFDLRTTIPASGSRLPALSDLRGRGRSYAGARGHPCHLPTASKALRLGRRERVRRLRDVGGSLHGAGNRANGEGAPVRGSDEPNGSPGVVWQRRRLARQCRRCRRLACRRLQLHDGIAPWRGAIEREADRDWRRCRRQRDTHSAIVRPAGRRE